MASSYSQNGIELQAAGENTNTWGAPKLNNGLKRLNWLYGGYQSVTVTDGTNTLTSSTSSTSQADFQAYNGLIKLTGSPTANFSVVVPSAGMQWWFYNATSYTATITTGSGVTATVEAGDTIPIWCDGTNCKGLSYGSLTLKEYISAAVLAATGSLPAVTGNAGKFLYTDGATSYWKQVQSTDLGDYQTAIKGLQVALAVAL